MSQTSSKGLSVRLAAIEKLENELIQRASAVMPAGTSFTVVDQFILGAINRTLSQSLAFRTLVKEWNFSSAAIMVRTQLDTAMRINGTRYMTDVEHNIGEIFEGRKIYKNLTSCDGEKMSDAYLKEKLAEEHPWVSELYKELSDFVHLSFRHFWPIIASTDEKQQVVYFYLSGQDAKKDERNYYSVTDRFFDVTKMTSILLLGILTARHQTPKGD